MQRAAMFSLREACGVTDNWIWAPPASGWCTNCRIILSLYFRLNIYKLSHLSNCMLLHQNTLMCQHMTLKYYGILLQIEQQPTLFHPLLLAENMKTHWFHFGDTWRRWEGGGSREDLIPLWWSISFFFNLSMQDPPLSFFMLLASFSGKSSHRWHHLVFRESLTARLHKQAFEYSLFVLGVFLPFNISVIRVKNNSV